MKIKSANGVSGCLIYVHGAKKETYMFRVYEADGTFIDYNIRHCDLSITIDDEDAAFYTDESTGMATLDHAPETLGR